MIAREVLLSSEARFVERRTARFQDVDAAGIGFYPRLIEYFHDVYMALLAARGVDLPRVLREGTWGAPLKESYAEFLRPVRFGDALEVKIVAATVGDSELEVGYRLDGDGGPRAIGWTRHVIIERASFRRAPVPDELRRALAP